MIGLTVGELVSPQPIENGHVRVRVEGERVARFQRAVQLVRVHGIEHVLPEAHAFGGALALLAIEPHLCGRGLLVAPEAPVVMLGIIAFAPQQMLDFDAVAHRVACLHPERSLTVVLTLGLRPVGLRRGQAALCFGGARRLGGRRGGAVFCARRDSHRLLGDSHRVSHRLRSWRRSGMHCGGGWMISHRL